MTLARHQQLFAALVPRLIDQAIALGFRVTLGECYRTPEQAAWNAEHGKGVASSLHTRRCAIDLQLFRDDVYLTDSADYRVLGEWWTQLHPLARWGGDFLRPDGNHFSLEWQGVQ